MYERHMGLFLFSLYEITKNKSYYRDHMALEAKLKAKYGEELNDVDDVEELVLDEITKIDKLSTDDRKFLERFKSLSILSMNYLGLTSLENMPVIPTLTSVS